MGWLKKSVLEVFTGKEVCDYCNKVLSFDDRCYKPAHGCYLCKKCNESISLYDRPKNSSSENSEEADRMSRHIEREIGDTWR
jgi:transcription initiation factor IIE alpha subunit